MILSGLKVLSGYPPINGRFSIERIPREARKIIDWSDCERCQISVNSPVLSKLTGGVIPAA